MSIITFDFSFSFPETSIPTKLKWYLESSLNSTVIRPQDAEYIIASIAKNPIGAEMSRDFIKRKWKMLMSRHNFGYVLEAAYASGKTMSELKDAENLFAKRELGSNKMAAKRIVASIQNNIKWLDENEKVVTNWLMKKIKQF